MMHKPININEAIQAVKAAGSRRVRTVPMDGQNIHDGLYQIEVADTSGWHAVATGMPKVTAESIINQATSRVLLG